MPSNTFLWKQIWSLGLYCPNSTTGGYCGVNHPAASTWNPDHAGCETITTVKHRVVVGCIVPKKYLTLRLWTGNAPRGARTLIGSAVTSFLCIFSGFLRNAMLCEYCCFACVRNRFELGIIFLARGFYLHPGWYVSLLEVILSIYFVNAVKLS